MAPIDWTEESPAEGAARASEIGAPVLARAKAAVGLTR